MTTLYHQSRRRRKYRGARLSGLTACLLCACLFFGCAHFDAGRGRGQSEERSGASASRDIKWLGAQVQAIPERVARYYQLGSTRGAVITGIFPAGRAQAAGLQWGDLILSVDEVELASPQDLAQWSGVLDRESLLIGILRAGTQGTVTLRLRDPVAPPPPESSGTAAPAEAEAAAHLGVGAAPGLLGEVPGGQPGAARAIGAEASATASERPREQAGQRSGETSLPLLEEAAHASFSKGDLQQAVSRYEQILLVDPAKVGVLNNMGVALSSLGRFEEALAAFEEAIRRQAGFARAHFNRGITLWGLGRFEDALDAYRSAARLAPEFLQAGVAESDALLQLGRPVAALRAIDGVLEQDPNSVVALLQKGEVLSALENAPAAEAVYRKVLAIAPREESALLKLGIILDEAGRHREAVAVFDQLLQQDPANATVYHNRALARLHSGDASGAVADEREALRLAPGFSAAHAAQAQALGVLGHHEESILSWGQAWSGAPTNYSFLLGLEQSVATFLDSPGGVRKLQQWLGLVGAGRVVVDGVVGEQTRRALQHFQQLHGLNPSGEANGPTVLKLLRFVSARDSTSAAD